MEEEDERKGAVGLIIDNLRATPPPLSSTPQLFVQSSNEHLQIFWQQNCKEFARTP